MLPTSIVLTRLFPEPPLAKGYLKEIVSEIRVGRVNAEIKGDRAQLAATIAEWRLGSPSGRALIEISFAFQIPLSEFLQGQLDAVSFSTIRPLPLAAVKRLTEPRKLPEKRDIDVVKSYLASVENGAIPNLTTLRSVASRININVRELRRIAPIETAQLSKVLAGRRILSMQRKHEGREKLLRNEIPKALTKLLDDGLQPTRRPLHKSLTDIGISIRREEGPRVSEIVQQFFAFRNKQNISGNI